MALLSIATNHISLFHYQLEQAMLHKLKITLLLGNDFIRWQLEVGERCGVMNVRFKHQIHFRVSIDFSRILYQKISSRIDALWLLCHL